MRIDEAQLAEILGVVVAGFLLGFWFLPGGVLALRRRARGEIQVDVRPGYSPATLYRVLQLYQPEGIRWFRRMLLADMIFPAVYGALLFVLGDRLASSPSSHSAADIVRVAGVAAAVLDYAENIALLLVLRSLPRQRLSTARVAGLCTSLKTAGIVIALGALVTAILVS